MTKIKKSKDIWIFLLPVISILLILTIILLTSARMSDNLLNNNSDTRAANFHIALDKDNNSANIAYKLYATTKVTDITKTNGVVDRGSFINGALQSNSVVIHSDSNVKTAVSINVTPLNNDNRVFYAVVPWSENDTAICSKLYDKMQEYKTLHSLTSLTLTDIRNICNTLNSAEYELGYDDFLRLTVVIWSEHDAVYVDANNDGVADEDGKQLNQLSAGIPTGNLKVSYSIVQKD